MTVAAVIAHGTVTTKPVAQAAAGTEVEVTATAAAGYRLTKLTYTYTDAAGTQHTETIPSEGKFTMPAAAVEVSAEFEAEGTAPTIYTVTFNTDGGSAVSEQTVKAGEKATKPADPTKEGHTFKGWYLPDDTEYNFDNGVNANITLTAKWEELPKVYLNVFVVDQDLKPIKDATVTVPGCDDKEKETDERGLATFRVDAKQNYNISVITKDGYNAASSVYVGENGLDFTFVLQKKDQNSGNTNPVESQLLAGVEMYPNPVSVATVLHGVENAKRIAVYTVTGVQVLSQAVHGEKEMCVSVEHLAEGVYVVIVQTESGESKAMKLVVRR